MDKGALRHLILGNRGLIARVRPSKRTPDAPAASRPALAKGARTGHPSVVGLHANNLERRAARLPWSAEEQHVAVGVRNLEAAKTVVGIFEGRAECCFVARKSISKFDGERIRVWCIDEGIPPHVRMTL